jgi:hypothetical protein
MNLWNNKFRTDLERTHEACKFVMFEIFMGMTSMSPT